MPVHQVVDGVPVNLSQDLQQQEHLLLAIYSYFAEAKREFISVRTQQGLATARARGKQLGRLYHTSRWCSIAERTDPL